MAGRRERGRVQRETAALVLRAVALGFDGSAGAAFVRRRAEGDLARQAACTERRLLRKLLDAPCGDVTVTTRLLAAYAAALETDGRYAEADAALRLAMRMRPDSAELALRAARIARLRKRPGRARRLYARVRALDVGHGRLTRLAEVGEALLDPSPVPSLSRVVRAAIHAGDDVAAAVALEERAALRRAARDDTGAAPDRRQAASDRGDAASPSDRARRSPDA
ncbi:MAG TPA: hypothetical protein VF158_15300 [Longimicrobiales bacterium]